MTSERWKEKPNRSGIPAILLQHELRQILQNLLAVQSHKLLPTDLAQGDNRRCSLAGVFSPSSDRSEVRGRESSRSGKGELPDKGEGNQPGEV